MSNKRSHFDLDPDYEDVSDRQNKRQRVLEEGAKEATKHKIEKIIRNQFGQEIESKEAEIMNISEKLERSRTVLDRLRACVVASYFGNASQQKCSENKNSQQTPNIHQAVKKYLGKAPKNMPQDEKLTSQHNSVNQEKCQEAKVKVTGHHGAEKIGTLSLESCMAKRLTESPVPNSNPVPMTTKIESDQSDTRAGRFKVKKRIIVGNVSKTIPADRRDENDQATHMWMVYVRGPKDSPRIDHFVKKVWFFLHPSYRPNDLVEISEHPFHLTRRGWGEFPVRVQLHFRDSRNKRLDIIHNLKLDRTYTSLQTLGAETVVDVELEKDISEVKKKTSKVTVTTGEATITSSTIHAVKQEPEELNQNLNNNNNVRLVPSQVQVKIEPNGQAYIDETAASEMVRNIKTEQIDHDYGFPSHLKSVASAHNIKKQTVNAANFVIPGGSNNVQLVFSGIGGLGAPNILSSQVVPGLSSSNNSPVKIGLTQHTSPKSQKKGQAVLGSTVNLQGIGSISNSGMLIQNQQGSKNNTVPVLLGNSPTKIVGNQSALQPGSILLSPVLPTNTPVSGNQLLIQSGSLLSPALPVTQAGSSTSQANNSGLIFLKCTDNQGKTYLVPQQVCPNVAASKGIAIPPKGTNAIVNQTTLLLNNTQNQSSTNNKLSKLSSPTIVQTKPPVSSAVVNLNQLTAVGLQPKQTPMQLAGPLIFIKPEEVSKLGSQSKPSVKSPPKMASDASPLQTNQTLRLLTPSKSQIGGGTNSSEKKPTVSQSSIRGQLKVTSQGLITVQNNDTSLNKNFVIKTEPIDEKTVTSSEVVKTITNAQPASTVAKQPIIILPHNNKAPVSLQCKSTSLLSTALKVSSVSSINNVVIVNASNDLTAKTVPGKGVTNTTVSNQIKISALPANANGQKSAIPKTNMLLLQAKTPGSDKPNHLVIVPVSCANNTVTRPTVSIATVSSAIASKSSVVSKSLTTVCSTATSSVSTSRTSCENAVSDKNKTMYIVVEGNSPTERLSEVSEGQRSMTSLLNKAAVPTTSISSGTVSAGKSSSVKILPAQSLLSLSSTPSSTSTSVFSSSNTIPVTIASTSGQRQTQVLVVNSNNEVKVTQKPWKADEKKIISLAPKKKRVVKEPEKTIRSLNISDYPDMLSLMRAAVLRHPLVAENTAKYLHPYCAASNESWLNWNVGKRRAAEWQRASSMRKFILSHLDGTDNFKGEPLWSVKQILTWCRLHAYSPHYLEKQLHPTGLNLQSESSLATDKNHKFRSLSGCSDVTQEVDLASQKTSGHLDYSSDDDIDIIATEPSTVKVKVEVKDTEADDSVEQLPVSDSAHFIQEMAKKIGIKFSPTEVEPGCCGTISPDYIFSAMESFMSDILRETFALQVNMGRYPDALGVADVYRALSNLPITDFVTNKYFGVEDTGGVPTAYR